ncbi:unnamed protein product [Amoebophrya sp. A25]|nr:unnamed protein product [Amoebophrya sp. A25]|eukprot:GSA25T00009166001.1
MGITSRRLIMVEVGILIEPQVQLEELVGVVINSSRRAFAGVSNMITRITTLLARAQISETRGDSEVEAAQQIMTTTTIIRVMVVPMVQQVVLQRHTSKVKTKTMTIPTIMVHRTTPTAIAITTTAATVVAITVPTQQVNIAEQQQ